eukprot:CAMPEP_0179300584 /NCGR_PEP_ID=MMETSP0797-20121207/47110_1 /TAXON_ID=47934 /ORGANISM="Dinophysis acuminata, Strain DAEP01" /LENGTH=168 /DNA_ID=CAMNT_0021010059 /DNA_START=164 /DNA_END=671 /DNA_ORIENTATION=-
MPVRNRRRGPYLGDPGLWPRQSAATAPARSARSPGAAELAASPRVALPGASPGEERRLALLPQAGALGPKLGDVPRVAARSQAVFQLFALDDCLPAVDPLAVLGIFELLSIRRRHRSVVDPARRADVAVLRNRRRNVCDVPERNASRMTSCVQTCFRITNLMRTRRIL